MNIPRVSKKASKKHTICFLFKISPLSFDNILKINSSDVDKHFEKIKEVTTLAIKKAEEKALSIKQKVEDRMDDEDIENPSVVKKFKSIANKIKGLKKK
jgi:hypothetical protein